MLHDQRLLTLILLGVLSTTGCEWLKRLREPPPPVSTEPLKQHDPSSFVQYLNRQAGYLDALWYDDLTLRASIPGQLTPPLGQGSVRIAKPRLFRLKSGLLVGGDQLDIGSNDRELWMYVKPSQSFVYCSHTEFPKVQNQLPVPFEPDWVLQALGMISYDPQKTYHLEIDQKKRVYYLSFEDRTGAGQPVLKMLEFAGDEATDSRPQVSRHFIFGQDQSGRFTKMLAVAEIKSVQQAEAGLDAQGKPVSLAVPKSVILKWPEQNTSLELTLNRPRLNEKLTNEEKNAMFTRPASIDNVAPINLAEFRQPSYR